MKPYIFNYSEVLPLTPSHLLYNPETQLNEIRLGNDAIVDSTLSTATTEPIDPDEILLLSTIETRTTEPVDHDEAFQASSTIVTKTLEPSDDDGVYYENTVGRYCSTVSTESIEPSDPDELLN